ncbi:MAG: sulfur carrier protein ThiS [Acidimicrobiales bacterium]|nr:sulfur carrier protein ThiS [Acidimicrobiales bacterium]MBO0886701.1 sulfur carrier protein ThiS [Acidimicrobiales bacterium]MBO0894224.1 sulfur carrier protein ThiS [Acidimicrobiales bacterium]
MAQRVTVVLNGTKVELAAGSTVAAVVADMGAPPAGRAVAVNGEVVPRSRWAEVVLSPEDRVEVLTAAQGG